MTQSIALLKLAVALLIAAQQPNVPSDLRISAINLAHTAISASLVEQPIVTPKLPSFVVPVATTSVPADDCYAMGHGTTESTPVCVSGIRDGKRF